MEDRSRRQGVFSPLPQGLLSLLYPGGKGAYLLGVPDSKSPMIREDFDPDGARRQQNRGRSGYRSISWDAALDIAPGRCSGIRQQYGPEAVMSRTSSSHHNWGIFGDRTLHLGPVFQSHRFQPISWYNPDSWEGWHWGATHALRLLLAAGHAGAVRPAGRRPEEHRHGNSTGATTRIRPTASTAARGRPLALLAAGPGEEADNHRPVLQLYRLDTGR